MGHRWDRSARRIEKLSLRLEWRAHGTVPIKPRGMHERTYQRILGMLAYHEAVRKQWRVMLESTNHESIVPICGGNAETDLLALVVGQFVVFRPSKARAAFGSTDLINCMIVATLLRLAV
jgi:hypothetical protein